MSSPKSKGGRPSIGAAFTLRLPAPLIHTLDALAARQGVSRAAVIRTLLERALTHPEN